MDGDGGLVVPVPSDMDNRRLYGEVFDEQFPYYLALGMTYDLYWNQDVNLIKAYRKSDKIRRRWESETANFEAWRLGLYFYSALCSASGMFNFFAGRRSSEPYVEKPFEFKYPDDDNKEDKEMEEEQKLRNGLAYFKALVDQVNSKRKGGETDG